MWRFYERQAATGQWTQRGSDLDVGAVMVPDLHGRTRFGEATDGGAVQR